MWSREVEEVFPKSIRNLLSPISHLDKSRIQEIRMRIHQPLEICLSAGNVYLSEASGFTDQLDKAYVVSSTDISQVLQTISNHSVYAVEEQLRQGFITIAGGHRVGVTGKVALEGGKIRTMQNVTSFNIRIAKQVIGAATAILPDLYDFIKKRPYHTLIVSPPQCGKTTLLRDIVRQLSLGNRNLGIPSHKVGVVDERSELAGCIHGIPQSDLGMRTDVLDGCPKAEGMMLLIRSMSPQIIAVDEIGTMTDAMAIDEVLHAGVCVITTAHAFSLEELMERPIMREMIEKKIFDRYVLLSNMPKVATVQGIYDRNLLKLSNRRVTVG